MRLIRCHIENFGALHDMTVEFSQDFHLVARPNGWGKSTLAAFIRVMFFGFEGENKRSGTENERRRYAPWQGGVCGGQMTFETGGRTYTVARIFADKKANDSFELRDAATNRISEDFSENLGEEIFQINGASFARTVFIGQNDCATYATDSINAKISNLTDNMNDLDSYEKASGALKDIQNKLSPRRSTGRLSRLNDEITRMQTEVTQNAALGETIRTCEERGESARAALAQNRRQAEEAFALAGKVSSAGERRMKQSEYNRLCTACTQTEEAYRHAQERFPGEVPSEEELRVGMQACDEMELAAGRMRDFALTPEEQEALRQPDGQAAAAGSDTARDISRDTAAGTEGQQEDRKQEEPSKRWMVLLIIGIIVTAAGLAAYFLIAQFAAWLVVAVAGVVLIWIGRSLHLADARKAAEENEALAQMQQELERERAAKQEAVVRERAARRKVLTQKQQSYQTARGQYEEKRSEVTALIRRMGLSPKDPMGEQLQEIWRQRIDWQQAQRDAQAALQEKKDFESHNDMSFLIGGETAEQLPSPEEVRRRQTQLENEADAIRAQVEACDRQLTGLREQYDEWVETGERLAGAKEERACLKRQFDQVGVALKCLTTAKEAMTAKYMEPLMASFSTYYRILTGASDGQEEAGRGEGLDASRYRMDANTNLTVEAYGMQRETVFLSRGYQDMVGLCLRLALVDAMYPGERPFLVLDDPFVNLDEENRAGGRRLMEAVMARYQVIYFTCRATQ